jgi:hypothetical protein
MRIAAMVTYVLVGCLGASGAAHASLVPTLQLLTPVTGGTEFSYDVVLTGDQGLSTSAPNPQSGTSFGSKLVIYDFAGYVAGSVFTDNPLFSATVEQTTAGAFGPPGFVDNPALYNLVFTYTGGDLNTTGGPYANMSEGDFGAVSTISKTKTGAYGSIGVTNTGTPYPAGAAGTAAFSQGSVQVAATPEASTWAMTIIGFGVIGSTMRQRRRRAPSFA